MSQDPNRPLDETLFEDYLLGRLSDEQVTALDRTLREDPQARQAFAEAMQVMSLVRQEFADQAEYQAANQQEPLLEDFNTLLKELGEKEAAAQPVVIPVEVDHAEESDHAGSLSRHDYVAAGGYLLRHALRSRPAIIAAAAAIMLLATLIGLQFIGDSNEDLAQQPPQVDAPLASTQVATLTAQHNARWASASLAPGSPLRAGQRLTLTQGFAEITTEEGAVAILEAPATIELFDNDNALRLHAGKLVGICETPSSKGFLVRTPHMDITDLGTRFGVDLSQSDATKVHVFEGKVKVSPLHEQASPQQPVRLEANQALACTDWELSQTPYNSDIFAQSLTTSSYEPVASSGAIQFKTLSPHDLRQGKHTSAKLQVFLERADVRLDNDLKAELTGLDSWPEVIGQPGRLVEAGQLVDVYLLHMDKTGIEAQDQIHTLDFGRPILGVFTRQKSLEKTDYLAQSGDRRFDSEPDEEGLLLRGIERHDGVSIMPDGQGLKIQMLVYHRSDQVRVLVQSLSASTNP